MNRGLCFALLSMFFVDIVGAVASGDNCAEGFNGIVVAILVDVSEPLSQPNLMSYQALVTSIVGNLPKHSRIDVYKIASGSTGVSPPVISLCKPGPKSDNPLMYGQKYWENRINSRFTIPIKEALDEIGRTPVPGKTSPILESIFSISIQSFRGELKGGEVRSKLIVISDFMQHSDILSFYTKAIPDYSVWRTSTVGRSWVRAFGGVELFGVVIPRSGASALPRQGRDFFVRYFQDNFQKMVWIDIAQINTVKVY